MTDTQTEQQAINIDARKLFNLGANLLVPALKTKAPKMQKSFLKS